MGRNLGYFDSDELDRPELNKCPDCECYFASEECPLCGKICPEAFRAGNRAPVKKPKKRKNSSGRVQFISWYHSWWFILIMMFVFPLAGIVLFITSPYSKKWKIIITAVVVAGWALTYTGVGWYLLDALFSEPLVNDDIPRGEYVALCEPMTAEEFYRDSANTGSYATLELTVVARYEDLYDGESVYYLCRDVKGGGVDILIRDCNLEKPVTYMAGDMLRVWGENAGFVEISPDYGAVVKHPCLNAAYLELIG